MGNNISKAQEYLAERFYTPIESDIPLELILPEFGGSALLRFVKRFGTSRFLRTGLWQLDGTNELFFVKIFIKPNANWTVLSLIKSIKKDEDIIKDDRRLNHVLTAFSIGENNKFAWYVRPYISNSLSDKLLSGSLDLRRCDGQYILFQLLQIINALHECNIPCGGLNPNNLLLTGDNMLWLSDCPLTHHIKPYKIPLYQPSPYMYYYECDSYYDIEKEGLRYLAPECYLSYDVKKFYNAVNTTKEKQLEKSFDRKQFAVKNDPDDDVLKDPILAVKERSRLSDLFSLGLIIYQLIHDLPSLSFGLRWMKNVIRSEVVIDFDLIKDSYLNTLLRTLLSFSPNDRDDLSSLLREGMLKYFPGSFQQVLYPLSLQHSNECYSNGSLIAPLGRLSAPITPAAMSTIQSKLYDEEVQLYMDLFLVEQNPVPLKLETSIVLFDRLAYIFETAKYERTKLNSLSIIQRMLIYSLKVDQIPQKQELSVLSSSSTSYESKMNESVSCIYWQKFRNLQYYFFQKVLRWILNLLNQYLLSNPKTLASKPSSMQTKKAGINNQLARIVEIIFKEAAGINCKNFQVKHYELCSQLGIFLNLVIQTVESEAVYLDGFSFLLLILLPTYIEGETRHLAQDSSIQSKLRLLISRIFKLVDSYPTELIPVSVKILPRLIAGPEWNGFHFQYDNSDPNDAEPDFLPTLSTEKPALKYDSVSLDRFIFFQTVFRLQRILLEVQNNSTSTQFSLSNVNRKSSRRQLPVHLELLNIFSLLLDDFLKQCIPLQLINEENTRRDNRNVTSTTSPVLSQPPICLCWVLRPLLHLLLIPEREKRKSSTPTSSVILSLRWIHLTLHVLSIHKKSRCKETSICLLVPPLMTLFKAYFGESELGDSMLCLDQSLCHSIKHIGQLLYFRFAVLFAELAPMLALGERSILRLLFLSATFGKDDVFTNTISSSSSVNYSNKENRKNKLLTDTDSLAKASYHLWRFKWHPEYIRLLPYKLAFRWKAEEQINTEEAIKFLSRRTGNARKRSKKPLSLPGVVPRVTRLAKKQSRNRQVSGTLQKGTPSLLVTATNPSFYRSIEPLLQLYQIDQRKDQRSYYLNENSFALSTQWIRRVIEVANSEDTGKVSKILSYSLFSDLSDSLGWHTVSQYDHRLKPGTTLVSLVARRRLFGPTISQVILRVSNINLEKNHHPKLFDSATVVAAKATITDNVLFSIYSVPDSKPKIVLLWQSMENDTITDMVMQSCSLNPGSNSPNSHPYPHTRYKQFVQNPSHLEKKKSFDDKSRISSFENNALSFLNNFSMIVLVACYSGALHELNIHLNISIAISKEKTDFGTQPFPRAFLSLNAPSQTKSSIPPYPIMEIFWNSNVGVTFLNIQLLMEKIIFQTDCPGHWKLFSPCFFLLPMHSSDVRNHLCHLIFLMNTFSNLVLCYDSKSGHVHSINLPDSILIQPISKESSILFYPDYLSSVNGNSHLSLIGKDSFHPGAFYITDFFLGRLINVYYFPPFSSVFPESSADMKIVGFLGVDPSSLPYLLEILAIQLLSSDQYASESINQPNLFIFQMKILKGLFSPFKFSFLQSDPVHFIWVLLVRQSLQVLCLFAIHILSGRIRLLFQLLIIPSFLLKDESSLKTNVPSSLSFSRSASTRPFTGDGLSSDGMDPVQVCSFPKLKVDDSIFSDLSPINAGLLNLSPELPAETSGIPIEDKMSLSNPATSIYSKWQFFLSLSDPLTSGTILTLSNPLQWSLTIHMHSMIAILHTNSASNKSLSVSSTTPGCSIHKYHLNPMLQSMKDSNPNPNYNAGTKTFDSIMKGNTENSSLNMLPGFYLSCKLIIPVRPDE